MKPDSTDDDDGGGGGRTVQERWKRVAKRTVNQASGQTERLLHDISSGNDLSQWEPDLCIQMLRIPAAHNYSAIHKLLKQKQSSKQWMLEFLECDGLGVLLESLEKLGSKGFSSVADTFSQLQCVSCLRAVMNSQVGLEYIVQHREYTRQLANILMSRNNSVKLQVFELLCALCIYSRQGHSLALDSLNYFKLSHGRRYRFDFVIHELQSADTVAYKTTLLSFVNCIILGAPDVHHRNRLRTELYGVGLEKALSVLREEEDNLLEIQLNVFDKNQQIDEEQVEPLSVFYLFDILYKKVVNTPQILSLQSLLLTLSQINPSDPESDLIWDSLQEAVSYSESPRKSSVVRKSSVRTRDAESQTTIKRWVSTKRRASSTVGIQVGSSQITSSNVPNIDEKSDLKYALDSSPGSPSGAKPPTVEICANCHREFVRGKPDYSLQNQEENNNEHIPNDETKLSPPKKLSFTKLRTNSTNTTGLIVDASLVQNIVARQVSPISKSVESGVVPLRRDNKESIPVPPPLPDLLPLNLTALKDPKPIFSSPPIPPPLPELSLHSNTPSFLQRIPIPPPLPKSGTTPVFLQENQFLSAASSPKLTNVPIPPPLPQPANIPTSPIPPPPPPMPSTNSIPNQPPPPPPPLPSLNSFISSPPPPPPPLPVSSSFTPSPPPPPPLPFSSVIPTSPSTSSNGTTSCGSTPPPPPPPMMSPTNGHTEVVAEPVFTCEKRNLFTKSNFKSTSTNYHTLPSRRLQPLDFELLKFNTLPKPSKRMKTLNWTKVSNQGIGNSIWANVSLPEVPIDYRKIDELFCQKPLTKSLTSQSSLNGGSGMATTLLDNKRSLAVNIFLKQFKQGASGVLDALRNCDSTGLTSEKLKGFLRILPDEQEVSLIRSFSGDSSSLDTAERFFLELLEVPDYTLRVQAMLQKEECPLMVADLTPQLEAVVQMCDSLVQNNRLAEFLALLLHLGNYLNAGSYAGNAAGFKLNTLPKLLDTRANKPRMTFLHLAVEIAQTQRSDMLAFIEDVNHLRDIARNPLASIQDEIKVLANSVRKLDKQVKASKSKDILSKFKDFLKQATKDVEKLEALMVKAKSAEQSLAEHFCEDPNKFQLEECFTLLADFFSKVKQAIIDNEQRKRQEERAAKVEAEKTAFNSDPVLKKKSSRQKIFGRQEETELVDILMNEIKVGKFKPRRSCPISLG